MKHVMNYIVRVEEAKTLPISFAIVNSDTVKSVKL